MKTLKKENSSGQCTTWYNTKLFHVNGKQLKFYLKGYNKMEFRRITTIIEAYGGKLSEPTGDTIIFTEQDHPIGIHQCYYVKYLQDCIVANQLLDMETYKLPLDTNRYKVKKESTSHAQMQEKAEGGSEEFDGINTKNRKKSGGYYSEEEDRKIIEYIISRKKIAQTGSLYLWEEVVADNIVDRTPHSLLDHFRRKLIYKYEQFTCDPAACGEFEELLEKRGGSIKENDTSRRKHCNIQWNHEENKVMMDYIVKNNLINRMRGRATCRKIIEKAGLKNGRSVFSVQNQIHKLLHKGYQEYVTNPEALKKITAIHEKIRK